MIADLIDELRDEVLRNRGLLTIGEIADQMGLTRNTLAPFLRGGSIGLYGLQAVEAWVEKQRKATHG